MNSVVSDLIGTGITIGTVVYGEGYVYKGMGLYDPGAGNTGNRG